MPLPLDTPPPPKKTLLPQVSLFVGACAGRHGACVEVSCPHPRLRSAERLDLLRAFDVDPTLRHRAFVVQGLAVQWVAMVARPPAFHQEGPSFLATFPRAMVSRAQAGAFSGERIAYLTEPSTMGFPISSTLTRGEGHCMHSRFTP